MTGLEFANSLLDWVGVPYLHQGRSRAAVDCVGLPLAAAAEAGVLPPEVKPRADYGRRPMQALEEELQKYCILSEELSHGMLLSIRWSSARTRLPAHIAVLTPSPVPGETQNYIIHAHLRARRVVHNPYSGPWVTRTHRYWKLPGIDYE